MNSSQELEEAGNERGEGNEIKVDGIDEQMYKAFNTLTVAMSLQASFQFFCQLDIFRKDDFSMFCQSTDSTLRVTKCKNTLV